MHGTSDSTTHSPSDCSTRTAGRFAPLPPCCRIQNGRPHNSAAPGSNNGGASNEYQTVTLYLYQSGFETQHLGYAAAIAWALFLVIIIFALGNFLLTRRIAAAGGDDREVR